jgi:plasmid stability protein
MGSRTGSGFLSRHTTQKHALDGYNNLELLRRLTKVNSLISLISMTSITIRKLPHATKERLRVQAARTGLSLEAHTRRILQAAAEAHPPAPQDLASLAQACFGKENGVELSLPPRGNTRAPITFD